LFGELFSLGAAHSHTAKQYFSGDSHFLRAKPFFLTHFHFAISESLVNFKFEKKQAITHTIVDY
jgi:hypothetical protein